MTLTPQDIRDILKVLDESPYDEMTLDTGRFTLHLKRQGPVGGWQQNTVTRAPARTPDENPAAMAGPTPLTEPALTEPGLLDVRSPMPGTFYRSPKPGAEPFVSAGAQVGQDSVIAIIEVMKLMNAIPAGVSGEVVEILVDDASLVTKGQLLMRVRPARSG